MTPANRWPIGGFINFKNLFSCGESGDIVFNF